MYDDVCSFKELSPAWQEALKPLCQPRQAAGVGKLARVAKKLKKALDALEAKYSEAHKALRESCVHPLGSAQVLKYSLEDTLGNNRTARFTVRCDVCGKYLAETDAVTIRSAGKIVLQPKKDRIQ
jgi:hypothetical protein